MTPPTRKAIRQKNHVANGLCRQGCGRPLATKTLCQKCIDIRAEKRKEHVVTGLCVTGCGRPLATKTLCRECADAAVSKLRKKVAAGLCRTAGCVRPLVSKSQCRECAHRLLERIHGLNPGDYETIRARILNCQACGAALTDGRGKTARCIDHNHATGVRRGVICGGCNSSLGYADDSSARLRAIADYIDRCNARDK